MTTDATQADDNTVHMDQLALDLISADDQQIRKHFDETALRELGESILQNGMIQPIVVRPNGEAGQFKIIAGERRHRAAKLAGLQHVPVIVRPDLRDQDIRVLQILENMQREDLSLAETCTGVTALVEQIGFAQTVQRLGKSDAWVSKHAGLNKLPAPVAKLVGQGAIQSVDIAKDLGALYELSPKKAENLIARLTPADEAKDPTFNRPLKPDDVVWCNGQHKRWGDLTEVEREARQLDQSRRAERSKPTRHEIRLELVNTRVQHDRSAEKKEQKKAEREALKADPKAAQKAKAAQTREANKKANEREHRQAIEQANEDGRTFADDLTVALNVLAGREAPKRQSEYYWGDDIVVEVAPPHYHQGTKPPATPEGGDYRVESSGTVKEFTPVAKLFGLVDGLQLSIQGPVTLIEAQKIAELLGGKRTYLRFDGKATGAQLKAIAEAEPQKPSPPGRGKARKAGQGEGQSSKTPTDTTVPAFIKACVKPASIPVRRIQSSELHSAYTTWCKAQGHAPIPLKDPRWGQAFSDAGIEKIRSNGIHYIGVAVEVAS